MRSLAVAACLFALPCLLAASESLLETSGWTHNGLANPVFEINGTDGRNNPLRKQLKQPFSGKELFVRYRVRYQAYSIDLPEQDEGEFFVLWLDESEGGDGSTHSGGVPNVGIHVSENRNRFMVRYSPSSERFGDDLVGDREFLVVARLWKSSAGEGAVFDHLSLWIDPKPETEFNPDISTSSTKSISVVRWVGFSTGAKTELEDRIFVSDIELSPTWHGILGLPPVEEMEKKSELSQVPQVRTIHFDQHILPILESKCFQCHEGDDAKQGIRLDIHDEVLNVSTPGNAQASHIFDLVKTREMPPEGKGTLSNQEIALLQTWIDEGVDWDHAKLPTPIPKTQHWSFQPIVRPDVPVVSDSDWVKTPVDAYIRHQQVSLGIDPATEASDHTLARRLSLDLLGLPPGDARMTVDQYLDDPAYGERWGRHWLDVARWAESNGHQHNRPRLYAWRYRDWVVEAFRSNMPFDEFLQTQIAGDEMKPISPGDESRLVATGFLAAARYSGNELDKEIQRNDILVDIVNTTGNAFLGLTFECAQCHTHKFDPISIRDYYRMQAFFADGQPGNVSFHKDTEVATGLVDEHWKLFDETFDRLVSVRRRKGEPNPELVIPKTVRSRMNPTAKKRFAEVEKQISALEQTWAYFSPSQSSVNRLMTPHEMRWPLERDIRKLAERKTYMLLRGDIKARGPEVSAGWPLVFGAAPPLTDKPRTALAEWMTATDNPLTARVWVNRIWHWHFGKGLVKTVGDFGAQGLEPTHPELLDYLASELIDSGWNTRRIHRLIVESATYRQSSQFSQTNHDIDPDNTTYWRWVPRRLESEAIRDSMLAASGLLDQKSGGPSDALNTKSRRRSLYLKQERDRLPDQQQLFDTANGIGSCAQRRVSTNALQPLWLMNSEFSQEMAEALAKRSGTVAEAFQKCLGRAANADELAVLTDHAQQHGLPSACLAILNSSEFLYIP